MTDRGGLEVRGVLQGQPPQSPSRVWDLVGCVGAETKTLQKEGCCLSKTVVPERKD